MNALITGATSGIGKEFAYLLAEKGYDLVIIARNKDNLQMTKTDIEKKYQVNVHSIPLDLSLSNAPVILYEKIKQLNLTIDVLINNAGNGYHELFVEADSDLINNMIALNVNAITLITKYFLTDMVKNNSGKILIVSSTCAFAPDPYFSVYAATKAYELMLVKSLYGELSNTNVSVCALCPGPTKTAFSASAGRIDSKHQANPKAVALSGYKGLMKGKLIVIPGFKNKIAVFFSKLIPNKWLAKMMKKHQSKLKKS